MKLPKLQKPDKYVGLFIFDFGGQVSVGFTGQEVAELLESEKYKNCKVYKIYKAYPDGRLELKGMPAEIFQLEAGMFFYSSDLKTAQKDYKELVALAVKSDPPSRAKVHLSMYGDEKYVVAIIYPAEYNDEFGNWLLQGKYKTSGAAEGGIEATERYYNQGPEVLERYQLSSQAVDLSKTGLELLSNLKVAVQR